MTGGEQGKGQGTKGEAGELLGDGDISGSGWKGIPGRDRTAAEGAGS